MKKLLITGLGVVAIVAALTSCNAGGDNPGRAYMPDMYYSRAYETYGYNDVGGEYDSLKKRGILYNGMPVPGSIARGDEMPLHLLATSDSDRLKESNSLVNPIATSAMNKGLMTEAQRLYLINCAICHGQTLDGNGPLYNDGKGPFPSKPANFMDATIKAYPDGHYFDVITHGIRTMGSYASQLTPTQRWWVINYIRSKQGGAGAVVDSSSKTPPQGAVVNKVQGDTSKRSQ